MPHLYRSDSERGPQAREGGFMNQTNSYAMGQHLPTYGNLQVTSYLITTHHDFTRNIMEEIAELLLQAHREMPNPPAELEELSGIWEKYQHDMLAHLRDEEEILFPWIEQNGQAKIDPANPSISEQIKHMLSDHKHHEDEMEHVKHLADNLSVKGGYIPVLARLAYKLKQLNTDLKEHMEIETNLLFPRMLGRQTK